MQRWYRAEFVRKSVVPTDRIANFIVAGTEKAGTTSVFVYLGQHPEVCTASTKETNFFRCEFTSSISDAAAEYAKYFVGCNENARIVAEASPAYLGEADSVIPRMIRLVPNVKLLFILREPINRFQSSYNFHVSRLNIPAKLSFSEYIELCMNFEQNGDDNSARGLDEWHLNVLGFGCYARHLGKYFESFPKNNIKVMFFEDLCDRPMEFMKSLSAYLGINDDFWTGFGFDRENVTFTAQNSLVHKLALRMNDVLEKTLRRRPTLKRKLVKMYKSINQRHEGYEDMSDPDRQKLRNFYAPFNRDLRQLLDRELPPSWCQTS